MRNKVIKPLNKELAGVDAALRRAAKAAQALARKTKTPCYVWEDGQIVNLTAQKRHASQKPAKTSAQH